MRTPAKLGIILVCLCLVTSTGCWDKGELDEIGIVTGIAFDQSPTSKKKIKLMLQEIDTSVSGEQAKATEVKNYLNIMGEGEHPFQIIRQMSTRLPRIPKFNHVTLILIGEEFAKHSLKKLDMVLRSHEILPSTRIVVVKGSPQDALNISVRKKEAPISYLSNLAEKSKQTSQLPAAVSLGEFSRKISSQTNFLCPRLNVLDTKNVDMSGAAIIDGKRLTLKGWLDSREMGYVNLLLNNNALGVIKIPDPKGRGDYLLEIAEKAVQIEPQMIKNKILFNIRLSIKGRVVENWDTKEDSFKTEYNLKIAQIIARRIHQQAVLGFTTMQKYQADVADLGKKVNLKYHDYFKKIKKDWDKHFMKSSAKIQVKVDIMEFGRKGVKLPKKV